jgi:hypothetical protein
MEIIRAINPRRLIGVWLVAIVAAGALIFLFPRTLQETPRGATSTTQPTTTANPGSPESAAQAWGNQATTFYSLAGAAARFTPTDVDPVAAGFAVGYMPAPGGGFAIATIALAAPLNSATPTAAPAPQTVCTTPANVTTPPTVLTDGTYLAWIATTPNGSGQWTQTVSYATLPSQGCTPVDAYTVKKGAPAVLALDQGVLVWQQANAPQMVQVQDLTMPNGGALSVPLRAPLATKFTPAIQLLQKRLLYQGTNGLVHVLDLRTLTNPVDTSYPAITFGTTPQVQLTTDGITWLAPVHGQTALSAWHLTWAAPTQPTAIVTLPSAPTIAHLAAAASVIAWDDGTNFLAWDSEKHVFVALHAAPPKNAVLAAHSLLLWYLTDDATPSLAIINTTTLGE